MMAIELNIVNVMIMFIFRNSFVRGTPHAVSQICIAKLSTGKVLLDFIALMYVSCVVLYL